MEYEMLDQTQYAWKHFVIKQIRYIHDWIKVLNGYDECKIVDLIMNSVNWTAIVVAY